jgi:hypothetical protein
MRDTMVIMKDGREYCAPIWEFNPKDGYIKLLGITLKLYFKDMISCITKNERVSRYKIGDVNEIERAKQLGWKGE